MKVKICGISSLEDVRMVASLQPDYMGFVLNYPKSPRSNTKKQVIKLVSDLKIPFVLLFVNEKTDTIIDICKEVNPFAVQLHGDETLETITILKNKLPPIQIWKAIHFSIDEDKKPISWYIKRLKDFGRVGCDLFILDSSTKTSIGGTGITVDWNLAKNIVSQIKTPILLAGGITPSNVKSAIEKVRPFGIDVSSGVERIKAIKEKDLVESIIKTIREYE